MRLVITVFGLLSGAELLLWLPGFWRVRRVASPVLAVLLTVVSLVLVSRLFQAFIILLAVLSIYRVVNLLRVAKNRMQADYLYAATQRTSSALIALQFVVLALAIGNYHYHVRSLWWLYAVAVIQIIAASAIGFATRANLKSARPAILAKSLAENELPTLTVALPARNETADLEACLQSLVASTYPKLEILVLDDCSQNKRTPEIIRDFAHDGVRFVAGQTPPDNWLAKNYAYWQLTQEASGELLLFCGVDTRFQPDSLKRIVELLLAQKQNMLSIVPRNELVSRAGLAGLLAQPARYAWELMLPRRLLRRPPALSTCWLIRRTALDEAGNFKAISRGHSPESYFAREILKRRGNYGFIASNEAIGLMSAKTLSEQRATAIRTRYPQLHRRPEAVCLASLVELLILIGPFALLLLGLLAPAWPLAIISALSCLVLLLSFAKIVTLTYRRPLRRGLLLLPFAAMYDIGLLNYSMWQYEFNEVIWKGRNVCIPLMRVVPKLPDTDTPT